MKSDLIDQTVEIRKLTDTMIDIATQGVQKSDNQDLILVYGLMLDCAYRIRQTIHLEEPGNS